MVLGVIVSCLLVHYKPAQAISFYSADASGGFTSCFSPDGCGALPAVPAGTGLIVTLGSGSTATSTPIKIGNAIAGGNAATAPQQAPFPPTSAGASASVLGQVSAPPTSFAQSFAFAVQRAVVFNNNTTTEAFPLLFDSFAVSEAVTCVILTSLQTDCSASLPLSRNASGHAHASVQLLLDGNPLATRVDGLLTTFVPSTLGLAPEAFLTIPLTPGFHALVFEVQADGFISEQIDPTPEPTTLLLFGSTVAGLSAAARWRSPLLALRPRVVLVCRPHVKDSSRFSESAWSPRPSSTC